MATNVLGFVANPIIGGFKAVASALPKDSPQDKFNRGYFNTDPAEAGGRISGNPANNVFAGMNAVSMFGNVSSGAQKRIDKRNETSKRLTGERKEKFDAKTKEFENQKKDYDNKRDNTVPDKGYTRTAAERKANPGRQDANTMSGGSDSAGGGGRGNYESSAIAQGTFVFGFFLDGDDAQQPVIMGCMGYNDYGQVMNTLSTRKPFVPFSGYTEQDAQVLGAGVQKADPKPNPGEPEDLPKDEVVPVTRLESTTPHNIRQQSAVSQRTDGAAASPVSVPSIDDSSPLSALRGGIRNAIQTIQQLQKAAESARNAASGFISDIESKINTALNQVSSFISGIMKSVFNKVMDTVLDAFNKVISNFTNLIPVNKKPEAEDFIAFAAEQLVCLFKKLIENIFSQIKSFVTDAVNRIVNVSQCFMNNFVGGILSQIKGAVGGVLGAVDNALSGILGGASNLLGAAGDVLSAIDSLFNLSFNLCTILKLVRYICSATINNTAIAK